MQLVPYLTFADPRMNQFVTPGDLTPTDTGAELATSRAAALLPKMASETRFQQAVAQLDHGGGLATLDVSGASEVDVTVAQQVQGTASGASHVKVFGHPGVQNVVASGGSTVDYP